MALSYEEIAKAVKSPAKRGAIQKAIRYQNRIKFHTSIQPFADYTQPVMNFLQWAKSLISHEKGQIFESLFTFPCASACVTSVAFDRLSRIFDGKNPVFNYQFKATEYNDDWEWYRKEILKEPEIWPTKGWEYFKSEINSILIVDLPREQSGRLPEPYFYFLPIAQVIDYRANENGNIDWLIFKNGKGEITVFDDECYRIFVGKKGGGIGEELVNNPHDLGYCPARFFWYEPLSIETPDLRLSPIAKELSALDWYLMFCTSKKHLDLYGAYPIYSGYVQDCNFHNDNTGDYCDGGFLKNQKGEWLYNLDNTLVACPRCSKNRILGAGNFVEVPVPIGDQPDLSDPVRMLSVDRESLDYCVNEEDRLKKSIISSIAGVDDSLVNDQAVNDSQIDAHYEGQKVILNRVKKGFEIAQQFVDDTICKLRYGDMFVSSSISYGTEFFTKDTENLRSQYRTAKESGASQSELEYLDRKIVEAESGNDPVLRQRMVILSELEPYRHMSRSEVSNMFKEGLITYPEMMLKLDFSGFIRRFERENMNVIEFGSEIPFKNKIDKIKETLIGYANEKQRASVGQDQQG